MNSRRLFERRGPLDATLVPKPPIASCLSPSNGAPVSRAALCAPTLAQLTWHVGVAATGPGSGTSLDPYSTIQSAIDATPTVSGDTLLIAAGIYQESINLMGKSLRLTGSSTPRTEIWGAPAAGTRVVTIASGETNATTFTHLDIVATGCTFTDNAAVQGGAIDASGGALVLRDCRFEGNTSAGSAGCSQMERAWACRTRLWPPSPPEGGATAAPVRCRRNGLV